MPQTTFWRAAETNHSGMDEPGTLSENQERFFNEGWRQAAAGGPQIFQRLVKDADRRKDSTAQAAHGNAWSSQVRQAEGG